MQTPAAPLSKHSPLQEIAAQRLYAARCDGGSVSISHASLGALLRLAADATYAADALLLLQELQVQQIELEMQLEELRRVDHQMVPPQCN